MNKKIFTLTLKNMNLSKKEFAELANISYNTVNNWNDDNRPIPSWVESWLKLYIDHTEYTDLKKLLKETVCQDVE